MRERVVGRSELVLEIGAGQTPVGEADGKLVSVIIPVLNNQRGLDDLLAALAVQTWPLESLEVLVVDNLSEPPIAIDEKYSNLGRLVKCISPGAYAARNAGVVTARGSVLAFTDSDCIPDPAWVAAGVAALERVQCRSVIGGEVVLSLSDRPTGVEIYQHLTGFLQKENITRRGFSATANLFMTHSQFDLIGAFDESLLSGGDREWCWRAARKGFRVEHVENVIVTTKPRTSLGGAIRQARRVAGGRFMLRRKGDLHVSPSGLEPHRGLLAAAKWILTHPNLSAAERAKVFGVASVLKAAQTLETLRLRMGLRAERR